MKDINFFSHYQGKNKEKKNNLIYIYGVAALVGFVIVVTLGVNTFRIYALNKSIEDYNAKLSAPEIEDKLKEAESINSQIEILTKYESALTDVSNAVNKRDNVSDKLLNYISSTVPSDVSFKSLDVKNDVVIIQGVSKSREAVGEMQHNLKGLPNTREVFVNSLDNNNSVSGEYSFEIKCVLRSVD
ncbi:PilN domain-containing protein [Clostridium uliginosum]|uniref:Type IV pilus assembly protein PilN n=1 Tax=Clostridium uliginosum TaxID=119641 RepID=A0A1I1PNG8_9CLOT|nr:PilN domain-containing protein [Clostridium uliginosum]SFD09198.1 type IV pilus assembly protein PilN [Clostridium uliginosum]